MTAFAQYLISGLVVGCIYGLVATGFTAVYNATHIVNFAQGESSMLAALCAAGLVAMGVPLLGAILVAVLAVGLLSVAVERMAIRPIGADVTRGIIITIGVGIVLQGLAALLWGTDAQPLPAFSGQGSIAVHGVVLPCQALWVLGTTAVLMLLLYLFLTRTFLGKAFRACAMNGQAAGLMGIPLSGMRAVGFLLSGVVGAAAGVIVAPIALMQYDSGVTLGIKGFVACIIGGFGNPIGAVLGGLLLGVVETLSAGYISSGFKNAIAYLLLLGFLLLRPAGLLAEFGAKK